jgi:hypothetical protein
MRRAVRRSRRVGPKFAEVPMAHRSCVAVEPRSTRLPEAARRSRRMGIQGRRDRRRQARAGAAVIAAIRAAGCLPGERAGVASPGQRAGGASPSALHADDLANATHAKERTVNGTSASDSMVPGGR